MGKQDKLTRSVEELNRASEGLIKAMTVPNLEELLKRPMAVAAPKRHGRLLRLFPWLKVLWPKAESRLGASDAGLMQTQAGRVTVLAIEVGLSALVLTSGASPIMIALALGATLVGVYQTIRLFVVLHPRDSGAETHGQSPAARLVSAMHGEIDTHRERILGTGSPLLEIRQQVDSRLRDARDDLSQLETRLGQKLYEGREQVLGPALEDLKRRLTELEETHAMLGRHIDKTENFFRHCRRRVDQMAGPVSDLEFVASLKAKGTATDEAVARAQAVVASTFDEVAGLVTGLQHRLDAHVPMATAKAFAAAASQDEIQNRKMLETALDAALKDLPDLADIPETPELPAAGKEDLRIAGETTYAELDAALEKLIADVGGYDEVHECLVNAKFNIDKRRLNSDGVQMIKCVPGTEADVLEEIAQRGFRPAFIEELMALWETMSFRTDCRDALALGSYSDRGDGHRWYPHILFDGDGRKIMTVAKVSATILLADYWQYAVVRKDGKERDGVFLFPSAKLAEPGPSPASLKGYIQVDRPRPPSTPVPSAGKLSRGD